MGALRSWRGLRRSSPWLCGSLLACLSLGSAHAESPQDYPAALALSAADGTVRTRAGVRLEISPAPGAPDRVAPLGEAVRTRMGGIRRCFASAIARSHDVHGTLVFLVSTRKSGALRPKVTGDDANDPQLRRCMAAQLARARAGRVPEDSRAVVTLALDNPAARVVLAGRRAPQPTPVRMRPHGMAEAGFSTGGREVSVQMLGSAYASRTLQEVTDGLAAQVAGLLDCRRKASRKQRTAEGTVVFDIMLGEKASRDARPRESTLARRTGACVAEWWERAAPALPEGVRTGVTLSVTFRE